VATETTPILERIVEARRHSIEQLREVRTPADWSRLAEAAPAPRNFRAALEGPGVALIAECKQRSPSGGVLQPVYDPVALARRYARNGAAAISVLIEPEFFAGRLEHLTAVRDAVDLPVLCKDFLIDQIQVLSARASGADAILLIAGILDDAELAALLALSSGLGMQALVEVHSEDELRRTLRTDAGIIGINNRDLVTMTTDRGTTARLRPLIPKGRLVVSESGFRQRADIDELARLEVDAVLIGESLLRAPDLDAKVRELAGR
jgi:indole-3-glycerol phosphate synthase